MIDNYNKVLNDFGVFLTALLRLLHSLLIDVMMDIKIDYKTNNLFCEKITFIIPCLIPQCNICTKWITQINN